MTFAELRELAERVGFPDPDKAAAVALAESQGVVRAKNVNRDGSIDRGLWQINSVHGRLSTFEPLANARAAYTVSKGGRDWSPWVAFKSGAYRKYLPPGHPERRGGAGSAVSAQGCAGAAVLAVVGCIDVAALIAWGLL